MEKNLNSEPVDGTYIRRSNLPAKKKYEQTGNSLNTMSAPTVLNASNTDIVTGISDGNKDLTVPVTPVADIKFLENNVIERAKVIPVPSDIKNISLNEFYMNGKHIKFGKWKVKTRNELNSCSTFAERRKVLVYDLMENFIPLDMEEFNYVLYRIREFSYNSPIKYSLNCSECGKEYDVAYKLSDLYRPMNGYSNDVVKEHTINDKKLSMTFSHITKTDFEQYENLITTETDEFKNLLVDFIYHIKAINGVEIIDRKKLLNDIEQWDTDIFEEFFFDFNSIKFYVDTTNKIKCPNCLDVSVMNFDEFPNFYPDSWIL